MRECSDQCLILKFSGAEQQKVKHKKQTILCSFLLLPWLHETDTTTDKIYILYCIVLYLFIIVTCYLHFHIMHKYLIIVPSHKGLISHPEHIPYKIAYSCMHF